MSEEYDLKKSKETIGQLYPILEAKDGEIIDGFHREEADRNWKRVRLEHIDTEEKKFIARLVANKQVESKDEVNRECINGLAELYKDLLTGGASVREKIADVTGLDPSTVSQYLDDKYKLRIHEKPVKQSPRVPASQAIVGTIGDKKYAEQLVERHREEVLAEEKPKIEQQVKEKQLVDGKRESMKKLSKLLKKL